MSIEILIPRSAQERRRYYKCFCGMAFPLDQKPQWVRHTKSCSKKNADVIEEGAERRQRNGLLTPLDKEFYAHIRQGGN